jgi:hypothetical protein
VIPSAYSTFNESERLREAREELSLLSLADQQKTLAKALLLYKRACYSEAYLEICKLIRKEPNNYAYNKLREMCLRKLGIKPREGK